MINVFVNFVIFKYFMQILQNSNTTSIFILIASESENKMPT